MNASSKFFRVAQAFLILSHHTLPMNRAQRPPGFPKRAGGRFFKSTDQLINSDYDTFW